MKRKRPPINWKALAVWAPLLAAGFWAGLHVSGHAKFVLAVPLTAYASIFFLWKFYDRRRFESLAIACLSLWPLLLLGRYAVSKFSLWPYADSLTLLTAALLSLTIVRGHLRDEQIAAKRIHLDTDALHRKQMSAHSRHEKG